MSTRTLPRVVVTGAGVVSAAGCSMPAMTDRLHRQTHCLTPISLFDATGLAATHAGQVLDFAPLRGLPPVRVMTLDRGTQMALDAARQALGQATLAPDLAAATGVAIGTSGSPQYQNLRVFPDRRPPASRLAALYMARSTPSFQADVMAHAFGLGGPRFAFGSASLGGLLAISHALDLLRAAQCPAILVGGGEIHTLMNALGMDTLGVAAAGPCTPFAGSGGMCFGEGAAFFVLERLTDAICRGVEPLAELAGAGISADAYSDVAQDPTGRGLARAVRKSLTASDTTPAAIGWIRACGTGQRDLDAAETIGLQAVFGDATPPVTSTEPYFGHANGVSPLLGLAAVVAALRTDRAPCLPDRGRPRAGPAVPMLQPGTLPDGDCLLTATAFGGSNGAVVVRRWDRYRATAPDHGPSHGGPSHGGSSHGGPGNDGPGNDRADNGDATPEATMVAEDRIVIAGMGAVSAFGSTLDTLLAGLDAPLSQTPPGDAAAPRLVDDAWLKRQLPGVHLQRRTRLVRMVLLAVHQALTDAGVATHAAERLGLLVGLTRGPVSAYTRFLEQTLQGRFDASTGRSLLRTGRFSVVSEVAHAFGLLGYSGAIACGVHGGVQTLAHGAEILRASPDLDGLLVVAADEWTDLLAAQYHRLGLLGRGGSGCPGGEGAAAVLLCRRRNGSEPAGDWAAIEATAFAGDTTTVPDPAGRSYSRAIRRAIDRAGCRYEQIDFAVGQSCGWPAHDQREGTAFHAVCRDVPLTSVLPRTGMAESAGGLFGAIAAAAALRAAPNLTRGMLIGSTERGAHAAVVLSRMAA